ncbi:MAG TPA: TetR/AcrR family transcriptional regulator, partial [Bryobacteraceae bacterium]|nr:TetR/AcrR family transcriptional regulator [Bryobacteraceae bacterium]
PTSGGLDLHRDYAVLQIVPKWDMMTIMQKSSIKNRKPASRKEITHERIVEVAARAIRRSGYDGTGVADIMKEAGLTHGGFYAHFPSREALLAEAADRAGSEAVALSEQIAASVPPEQALPSMVRAYLSKEHREAIETGCPVSALGSEMPRQAPVVRRAATRRIKEMIDVVARQLPDWGQPGSHEQALMTVATMVGTMVLARAVDDPKLSDSFLEAALKKFAPIEE